MLRLGAQRPTGQEGGLGCGAAGAVWLRGVRCRSELDWVQGSGEGLGVDGKEQAWVGEFTLGSTVGSAAGGAAAAHVGLLEWLVGSG